MIERSYRRVDDSVAFADLMRFLLSAKRTLSVVVVTRRKNSYDPCIAPALVQQICGEKGQVYFISSILLRRFNEQLENVFGIAPSGMRIFRPRMSMMDHHHQRHPIWNEVRIDQMVEEGRFSQELSRSIAGPSKLIRAPVAPLPSMRPQDRQQRPLLRIKI